MLSSRMKAGTLSKMRPLDLKFWIALLCASVVAILFLESSSPWRSTLIIFSVVFVGVQGLARQVSHVQRPLIVVPAWAEMYLCGGLATISAAFVFLSHSAGSIGASIAWFFVISSLYRLAITGFVIWRASALLTKLRLEFDKKKAPKVFVPHGIVFVLGNDGRRFLRVALMRVQWSLWRSSRHNNPTEVTNAAVREHWSSLRADMEQTRDAEGKGLRIAARIAATSLKLTVRRIKFFIAEGFGERVLPIFITPMDLRRFDKSFQEYVIANSSFCLGILPARKLAQFYGPRGPTVAVQEEITACAPGRVGRFIVSKLAQAEKDLEMIIARLHFCLGPSILLVPRPSRYSESEVGEMRGYDALATLGASAGPAVAVITERLTSCGMPCRRLDVNLQSFQRDVILELAEHGLAPLADSYLRFRLSRSNVERFYCLFDCIEVLLKYSVFILMADDAKLRSLADLRKSNKKPPLGAWRSWLHELTGREHSTSLGQELKASWSKGASASALQLAVTARNSGIQCGEESKKSSWLDWAEWLVEFRNVTKGHGGPDEDVSGAVLAEFHGVFLDLVAVLRRASLNGYLLRICKDGTEIKLSGWLRGMRRSSVLLRPLHRSLTTRVDLKVDTETYELDARVKIRGNEVLTWHGENKSGEDAYVNYVTGEIRTLGG